MKKNFIITLLTLLFVGCIQFASAQTYIMSDGTINTCSGTILDPGGEGDYVDFTNITQTICSTAGEIIQLSFISFETEANCDYLTLYDGNSTAAAIIGIYSGSTIPGPNYTTAVSNGCMTLSFHSDYSYVYAGFSANISCIPIPPIITLGQGGNTIVYCEGMLTDPGADANYPDNANVTQTICSGVPNQCVTLSFTSFNTEASFDRLSIYDGANINANLLGVFSGSTIPQPVSSSTISTGCLTFNFTSNDSGNDSGFLANLSCGSCQSLITLGQGGNTVVSCGGELTDPGAFANYPDNANVTQTICSGVPNHCVTLSFTSFNTEDTFDRLSIYDEANTTADLLGVFSGFNVPQPVSSSTNSTGCLTLEFTSNGSVNYSGFAADISCFPYPLVSGLPPGDCLGAFPICFLSINQPSSFLGEGIILGEINSSCITSGERNNAWYIINVQTPGFLGFNIIPNCNADYNWALYNLTNATFANIATDPNLEIGCSFNGSTFASAITGMNDGPNPQDETRITVASGDVYALLVNNFSGLNQCGYQLDFSLSSAGIIDNTPPTMLALTSQVSCGANAVSLSFSEFVKCNIIESSMFQLFNPSGVEIPISEVTSSACINGGLFDKDYTLLLGQNLTQGGLYELQFVGLIEDKCGYINPDTQLIMLDVAVCSGVETFEQPELEVRPNPMESSTSVSLKNYVGPNSNFNLLLMDAIGRKVFEKRISADVIREGYILNIPELASGTYTLMINNSHYTAVKRLVK